MFGIKLIFISLLSSVINPLMPDAPSSAAAANKREANRKEVILERGGQVVVRNEFGRVSVSGWDRDIVRATATRSGGDEPIAVSIVKDSSQAKRLSISPVYAAGQGKGDINLSISLPFYAEVGLITTGSGEISVTEINAPVTIKTDSGNVRVIRTTSLKVSTKRGNVAVSEVSGPVIIEASDGSLTANDIKGNLLVKIRNGSVRAERINGPIDVTIASGGVTMRDAANDVRVVAIGGDVVIECVKGRVEASNVEGPITLNNVEGDVDISTTEGEISFAGAIREGASYRFKSHDGNVRVAIEADGPGFTAALSSYTGRVEIGVPLKIDSPFEIGQSNRRLVGRNGDGRARMLLDSFSGAINLSYAAPHAIKDCK